MGLNEFPPQPREGLMTKQPPCAPWPAASFNQGIWHLPKLLGYEEQRRGEDLGETRGCRGRSQDEQKESRRDNRRGKGEMRDWGSFKNDSISKTTL